MLCRRVHEETLIVLHLNHLILGCIVTLAAIQIPIDIRKRQLSRFASLAALVAIVSVAAVDAATTSAHREFAISVVLTMLVSGSYFALHHQMPHTLGLGDVILVCPLAFAVAYIDTDSLIAWQFVAAITGTVHALSVRALRNQPSIPFGPHLLASSVLIAGMNI